MWRSSAGDERSEDRRSASTGWPVVGTFGLVTVLLLGSWALLKPAGSGPSVHGSSGSARAAAPELTGSISVTVRRVDVSDLTEAEARARQENLDAAAAEPNPFATAAREL